MKEREVSREVVEVNSYFFELLVMNVILLGNILYVLKFCDG